MPAFDLRTSARTARDHARTAGTALVNWWRAVSIEALCVAILWWIGLTLLGIPLAPVWALIGGLMTFVPNFGGVITVIFPVMMVLFSGRDLYRLGFVLGLYAVIVIIDQLVLQPWLLKRVTRVPIWASILVPSSSASSSRSGESSWDRRSSPSSTPSASRSRNSRRSPHPQRGLHRPAGSWKLNSHSFLPRRPQTNPRMSRQPSLRPQPPPDSRSIARSY